MKNALCRGSAMNSGTEEGKCDLCGKKVVLEEEKGKKQKK
jgi:hypothetical protein